MILVDNRTGSIELRPFLSQPSVPCHLDYGDFAFSGNGPEGTVSVGIERKALDDFVQSMSSGRLAGRQLIGLKRDYEWVYVVIEGVWRPDWKSGVLMKPSGKGWKALSHGSRRYMAREVWGFIQSLSVICGVQVIQTSNQQETAKWLDSAYGWWNKKWKDHKSHEAWNTPVTFAQMKKPNLVARIAAQFDGIGWDKARAIGEAMNLYELMNASENDFMQIQGIGPKIAESIVDQRREGLK